MVKINGKETNAAGKSISEYLSENGYDSGRVAVERNGEIVPRAQYAGTILGECDSVEIVSFVGGG